MRKLKNVFRSVPLGSGSVQAGTPSRQITRMSIRRALKTIAQLTCGISPRAIHVKALGGSGDCAYAASIPWEYRVEIQTYLAHHLSIAVERDTLVLTSEQAAALIELAMTRSR